MIILYFYYYRQKKGATAAASSFGSVVAFAVSVAARTFTFVVSENVQAFSPYFQLPRLVFELLPALTPSV